MKTFMHRDPVNYFRDHHPSVRLGVYATHAGRNDIAIEALEKGVLEEPENERINFNLGSLYRTAGRYEEAIPKLLVALKKDADYVLAFEVLVKTIIEKGDADGARKFASEYLQALSDQAGSALMSNKPGKAARHYSAAIQMGARNREMYLNLGTSYHRAGLVELAIASWQQGLEHYPEDTNLLWNLGLAFQEAENSSQAKEIYGKILDIEPENQDARREWISIRDK
jgi:tetratricopeptide (TPR) repeat protein